MPLYKPALANALTPSACILQDLLQKLVTEVEDGQSDDLSTQRDVKTIFPVFLHQEREKDTWPKGEKM